MRRTCQVNCLREASSDWATIWLRSLTKFLTRLRTKGWHNGMGGKFIALEWPGGSRVWFVPITMERVSALW